MVRISVILLLAALFIGISAFENGNGSGRGETAYAQDIDQYVYDSEGGLNLYRCIAKGNFDFLLFLRASISVDGLQEGFYEPFRDVLSRNQCQFTDVYGLLRQRIKLRKYIRNAFLSCQTEKLPKLRKAYNKLEAEIYYVRHVVDGEVVISLPYSLINYWLFNNPENLYYPTSKLYSEMKEKYVDSSGYFETTEFNIFFNKLQVKYRERRKTYVVCENFVWEDVVIKFNEFIDTIGGIAPAFEKAEKGIGGRVEKVVEATENLGFESYFLGLAQVKLNNQPAAVGLEEILSDVEKHLSGPTVPTAGSAVNEEEYQRRIYQLELLRNDLAATYEALYREAGDTSVELFVDELNEFDQTLLDAFPILNKLYKCSGSISGKICS